MEYALQLSDPEVDRYRAMAAMARAGEADLWATAGIGPGARVVDVGCGPGAILLELADLVGTGGAVVGVDGDERAVTTARALLDAAGYGDAGVRVGRADDTGLPAGAFDVAVMRHVLAHNGPREQAIVDHLATLVRPGGRVYLVDVDVDGMTLGFEPPDPDIDDLGQRYLAFHRCRGNDLRTGTRLGRLLATAGLEVVADQRIEEAFSAPVGVRPPPFAAADAMIADGLATAADVDRWRAAFDRIDTSPTRPTVTVVRHSAIGRRPT